MTFVAVTLLRLRMPRPVTRQNQLRRYGTALRVTASGQAICFGMRVVECGGCGSLEDIGQAGVDASKEVCRQHQWGQVEALIKLTIWHLSAQGDIASNRHVVLGYVPRYPILQRLRSVKK